MVLLIAILVGTICAMIQGSLAEYRCRRNQDSQRLEMAWTCIPSLALIAIALPSLKLLYIIDEVRETGNTVKAVGHQ